MVAIRGRIREERRLNGIERRRSKEALRLRERSEESEEEGGEEIQERETEEFGMKN